MKKALLGLVILLLAHNLFSQTVSPYFPKVYRSSTMNSSETQMTFFDVVFVSEMIDTFMEDVHSMINIKNDIDIDDEGFGTITSKYRTSVSDLLKMDVIYNVFSIGKYYTISSVKVTGDLATVYSFYGTYWSNVSGIEDINDRSVFNNTFMQDQITYQHNGGKPTIEIKSTKFKGRDDFITHMTVKIDANNARLAVEAKEKEKRDAELKVAREKKAKEDAIADEKRREQAAIKQKQRAKAAAVEKQRREEEEARKRTELEEQRKIAAEERALEMAKLEQLKVERDEKNRKEKELREAKLKAKKDTLANTKEPSFLYKVVKKKKKLTFKQEKDGFITDTYAAKASLEAKITKFMEDKRVGTYVIKVNYKIIYEAVAETGFVVEKYDKPGAGLMKAVKKVGYR